MTSELHLVIGAGGLLGKSVISELAARGAEVISARVPWSVRDEAIAALTNVVDVAESISADRPIRVYWCAGAGVTATAQEALDEEFAVFAAFLERLGALADTLPRRPVGLFLASSVGVYAGSARPPFDEDTQTEPLSPYGHAKLRAEAAATEAAKSHGFRVFIGRISNLYGPNQNPEKPQGLISVIARSIVVGNPVPLYVSLDTIRDYLFADDCAAMVIVGMGRLERSGEGIGPTVIKILGAGQATTISSLLADFRRLRRKRVLVVSSARSSSGQAPDLRVRSVVWPELDELAATPLIVGMRAVLDAAFASRVRRNPI